MELPVSNVNGEASSGSASAQHLPFIYKNKNIGFCKDENAAIRQRNDERYSRVMLRVGHEEQEIYGHPSILANNSLFFDRHFTKDNREEPIDFIELDPVAVDALINYLYTGTVAITKQNVGNLLLAATKFELAEVMERCTVVIQTEQLLPTNCLSIRDFASSHGFHDLTTAADTYINNNFTAMSECEDFLLLTLDDLLRAIKNCSRELTATEAILQAVIRWVKHDESTRFSLLPQLIGNIDLGKLFQDSPDVLKEEFKEGNLLQRSPECERMYFKMCVDKAFELNQSERETVRVSSVTNPERSRRSARESDSEESTEENGADENGLCIPDSSSRTRTPKPPRRADQLITPSIPRKMPQIGIKNIHSKRIGPPRDMFVINDSTSRIQANQELNSTDDNTNPPLLTPSQGRSGRPKGSLRTSSKRTETNSVQQKLNEKPSSSKRQRVTESETEQQEASQYTLKTKVLLYPKFANRKKYLEGYNFQTKKTRAHHEVKPPRKWSTLMSYGNRVYDIGGSIDIERSNEEARPSRLVDIFADGFTYVDKKSTLNESRKDFAACICKGYLYLIGGCQEDEMAINCAERILVNKRSMSDWETVDYLAHCRGAPDVAVLGDKIYVIGGLGSDGSGQHTEGIYLSSVERFDPEKPVLEGNWKLMPKMHQGRAFHKTAVLNNKIYAVGGKTRAKSLAPVLSLNTVEVFNPERSKWTFCASMNQARYNGAVFEQNGLLYAVGGNAEATPNMEVYDPRKDAWMLLDWPVGLSQEVDFLSAILIDSNTSQK